ncbi:RNA binding motif, single stranded interacting protein 3 [Mortierella hygrophila]|uniref:RNA binding motif, single stranded interacting protein 3 n=1 Tax=Mortierella hygrophila TaxID=979708 RepID=A0A9P6FBY9_9FUNG|nr:RNA binding motif, single stranded interacting protein 3 [Mortierella hygrophila]
MTKQQSAPMPTYKQQSSGHGHETTHQAQAPSTASAQRGGHLRQTKTHGRQQQHDQSQNRHNSLHQHQGSNVGEEHGSGAAQGCPFFMKPLTKQPDYRFNLYVKGLAPTTTTRSLYELFKPYGHILACKTIVDNESGLCRGGFVLFDNQTSCSDARRALTHQGLYIAVAHESVSIKNIPVASEEPPAAVEKAVPKLDDSDAFPSLPTKPQRKKKAKKKVQLNPPSPPSPLLASPPHTPDHRNQQIELNGAYPPEEINTPRMVTPPWDSEHADKVDTPSSSDSQFGHAFNTSFLDFEFDTGFIGTHQQMLTDSFNINEYDQRPSLLEKKTYGTIVDVDRYMDMWDMNTAAAPRMSTNADGARQSIHPSGAQLSSTVIGDFMLEDLPSRESVLYFNDLPDGLSYRELFETCASYGALILTSVEIRYINEDCCGQGKVTFESHRDSEVALAALSKSNYNVHRGDLGEMYPSEPNIDDHLYKHYLEQHQSYLRLADTIAFDSLNQATTSTNPHGFFGTTPSATSLTHLNSNAGVMGYSWNTPNSSDSIYHPHSNDYIRDDSGLELDMNGLSIKPESIYQPGVPQQHSLNSPASSSTTSLPTGIAWTQDHSSDDSFQESDSPSTPSPSGDPLQSGEHASAPATSPAKFMSYSDIVKVPPKPVVVQPPRVEKNGEVYFKPPSQDLRRRGNTSKSLDEKEYRLNLYLKDLEPTMDEFKLYQICVQFGPVMSCRTITTHHGVCTGLGFVMYISNESVDRAIKGLKKLGYHAEVAIQSATNKLRCKVKSDTLFLQNIPNDIKEAKLRDHFRPYVINSCNILKDPKTGQGKGVAFLKMKDVKVAERFIEEYHGRILGKDWKLPLQVSPAKH